MENQKFGAFIAMLRKERGLTQRQLADMLGVTDKAVSKWERGIGFPDIKIIQPLADALGVSVLEIMQSRRAEEQVSAEGACQAVTNVIEEAVHQREIERRNALITVLAAVWIVAVIFLVDVMQPVGFAMVCLPIMAALSGLILIVASGRRRKRKMSYIPTLTAGILLLLVPILLLTMLFFAFAIGGPVPG